MNVASPPKRPLPLPQRAFEWAAAVFDRIIPLRRLRPLQRLPSIKLKLTAVILAAIAVTIAASTVAYWLDLKPRFAVAASVIVALALVQVLARGITSPLRAMTAATEALAANDLTYRVPVHGHDELATLGYAFNNMAERIEALETERNEVLANISHDLRTPVAVMQASIENMIDGVSNTGRSELTVMLAQTKRLGTMVSQLTELAKLEAGLAPSALETFAVHGVLVEVVAEAEQRQPKPQIKLVSHDDGVMVRGSATNLHRVLANVVDNGLRHNQENQPLELTSTASNSVVTVEVRDHGHGVAPADLERMFDRFRRLESSRSPASGGSGLGLAIATRLIHEMAGTIRASNHPKGGLAVTITVPIAPA